MPRKVQTKSSFKRTEADKIILEQVGPNDYRTFASYYFDVELWDWQDYFLRYPARNKLVVAGIRSGKSFLAAFQLLHLAYWLPGSRLLNVCITADQAQIIFNDILMLAQSSKFAHWIADVVRHPYPVIRLHNGSEIWSRSIGGSSGDASTIRGWEFDVINIDEAAYMVNELAYKTLQGRLIGVNKLTKRPRHGLMTLTTTPKGAKSWLFDRWKLGDPAYPSARPDQYLSLRARTTDNKAIDLALLEEILSDYTEKQRQQELEGLFITDDALFNFEDLMIMCGRNHGENILDMAHDDPYVQEIEEGIVKSMGKYAEGVPQTIEWYEIDPEPNHVYINSWDVGARAVMRGVYTGRNASVGTVLDITTKPWKLVAWRYDTLGRYSINMERVKDWHDKYNNYGRSRCFTRIDSNGSGDVIHQMLEEDQYQIDGFKASVLSKGAMLQASAVAIERHWLRTPFIRRLFDQFQSYDPADDKKIAQDIVISLSQGIHLARELERPYGHDENVARPVHTEHSTRAAFRRESRTQRTKNGSNYAHSRLGTRRH